MGPLTARRSRTCASLAAAFALIALVTGGCSHSEAEVRVNNAFPTPMTLAVAPILNFSGDFNLDPIKTADLLASELSFVEGVTVLPVNRVIAVLAAQGKQQIESPAHALAVTEAVGADAIIVAGITEYDAYTPIVGVAVQIYELQNAATEHLDAVQAARQAEPFAVSQMAQAEMPIGQVQVVYNAAHAHVTDAVRKYAALRSEGDQNLGWRQYLKVQTLFIRFCWHDALSRLMAQHRCPRIAAAEATTTESPT
ncbi:MAG TPA: hypothetical protein VJZ71_15060 [Phycisphaerae bacterium]|nr:hypothetical protein [Phycisphaerae bacterium]